MGRVTGCDGTQRGVVNGFIMSKKYLEMTPEELEIFRQGFRAGAQHFYGAGHHAHAPEDLKVRYVEAALEHKIKSETTTSMP